MSLQTFFRALGVGEQEGADVGTESFVHQQQEAIAGNGRKFVVKSVVKVSEEVWILDCFNMVLQTFLQCMQLGDGGLLGGQCGDFALE